MIRRRAASLLVAAGSAVALAACTSSHGSTGPSTPGSSTPTSSTPASSTAPTATALQAMLLQKADFPSTWTATAVDQQSQSDSAANAAIAQCTGLKNTTPDRVATASSDSFSLTPAEFDSVGFRFRSQADIDNDIAVLRSPKANSCYGQLLKSQITSGVPSGTTVQGISIKVSPDHTGLPDNVAGQATGTVALSSEGRTQIIYLAVAFITGPLTEGQIDAESIGQPLSESMYDALVTKVADRMRG